MITEVSSRFLKRFELGTGLLHISTGSRTKGRYSIDALTFGFTLSLGYKFPSGWALASTTDLYLSPLYRYGDRYGRDGDHGGTVYGARTGLALSYRKMAGVSDIGLALGYEDVTGFGSTCDCNDISAAINKLDGAVYIAPYVATQRAVFRLTLSRHHDYNITSYVVMPQISWRVSFNPPSVKVASGPRFPG